jgi:CheY-like chemotaxis protein
VGQHSKPCADNDEVDSALSLDQVARSECVLVVDDELTVREFISDVLLGAGHRVVTACSAQEAIRVVETEEVAVVLTDIHMPGRLSGLELIDALHELRPSLPSAHLSDQTDRGTPLARDRG